MWHHKVRLLASFIALMLMVNCAFDPNVKKLKYLNNGEKYLKRGNYQAAKIEFLNAIKLDPRFEQAHYQLAKTYLKLAYFNDARRELETTVSLNAANSEAELQLAGLLLASQQYKHAQQLAEKIITTNQGNISARKLLGATYVATHDLPKAVREFQKAIEIDPQRLDNYLSLGAIYLSATEPIEAEGVYKKAVVANSKSSQARVALGQFYFSQGRTAEAEATLRAAIELDTHAVVPRLSLIPVYLATERTAEAEKVCLELKTMALDNPQAYQALGLLYLFTGQKEKAAAEFRAVSQAKPNDSTVKILWVDTLIELRQIREAEPLTRELLKANPGDPQRLLLHSRILIAESNYDQALIELEKVLKAVPRSATGFYFLGVAQKALGFSSQAKSSWASALELEPQRTDAQLALADIDADAGNYEEALRLTGDALKTHPNLLPAYLIRARVLLAERKTKEGEALLQAVLDRDPASLVALEMLVKLGVNEKRSQGVLQRISKLVGQHPQSARLRFLQAVAFFSLNDLGNAEASAKQAIMLDRPGSDGYTLLADIHRAQGSVEKAKDDLLAAIAGNPRKVVNYVALESLHEIEGDWEGAKRLCEKAREIDPDSALVANNLAYLSLSTAAT
jgi:tetratricopeptide (TPR) repeat protein